MNQPDIATLLRARTTLIWITTREELRVERSVIEAAAKAGFDSVLWDCEAGVTTPTGRPYGQGQQLRDPEAALTACKTDGKRQVWIFRDLDAWLSSPTTVRALKSIARDLQAMAAGNERAIIVVTPNGKIPESLQGSVTSIDWPLPNREEVGKILDATIDATLAALKERTKNGTDEKTTQRMTALQAVRENGKREAAVDAAVGLTAEEVAACYARSLVSTGTIDADKVRGDKAGVISREKVLEWYEPDPRGLDAIGGLDNLKAWLLQRKLAFSDKARKYGLPLPKGVFLVGVSGCGKSLTAKAVATAWGMPLLRLDIGALKSKWVGESEANIRRALRVAESVAPCIVWVDELDKSMAGSTGPQGDGGVGSDALGTLLTWQQERSGACFLVATANDVTGLPPELLRKGRFDEVFFVDLPSFEERVAIFAATIRQFKRDPELFDLQHLASETSEFTGAEIASVIPEGLFTAFAQDREPCTDDLIQVAGTIVPLSRTASEKMKALRQWATGRARRASLDTSEVAMPSLGRTVME